MTVPYDYRSCQVPLQHPPKLAVSPLQRTYHLSSPSLHRKVSPGVADGYRGRRRKHAGRRCHGCPCFPPRTRRSHAPQKYEKLTGFSAASSFHSSWLLSFDVRNGLLCRGSCCGKGSPNDTSPVTFNPAACVEIDIPDTR